MSACVSVFVLVCVCMHVDQIGGRVGVCVCIHTCGLFKLCVCVYVLTRMWVLNACLCICIYCMWAGRSVCVSVTFN